MFLAIATETRSHHNHQDDYRVWYLETDERGEVIGVGVKSKRELIQSLFENHRKFGHSNWKAFLKGEEKPKSIEILDFVSQGMFENTHFGELPTLSEFQNVLDSLQSRLELKSAA